MRRFQRLQRLQERSSGRDNGDPRYSATTRSSHLHRSCPLLLARRRRGANRPDLRCAGKALDLVADRIEIRRPHELPDPLPDRHPPHPSQQPPPLPPTQIHPPDQVASPPRRPPPTPPNPPPQPSAL